MKIEESSDAFGTFFQEMPPLWYSFFKMFQNIQKFSEIEIKWDPGMNSVLIKVISKLVVKA